jgi:UDP-glucose 4-epimerase
MRVFITGGAGFLGSYLAADLASEGHEVAVLVRPGTNTWRLVEQRSKIKIIGGSLDDLGSFRIELAAFRPEAVAHMAWRGVANLDRNDPAQARNITHALELAVLCAELGVTVFVGSGSQAEYGPYGRIIREDDATAPTTLYGWAKLAAGAMTGHLCEARGLRFAWLRIFSTYGPKDSPGWLIPNLINTLKQGQRMSLTACEQRWGFLHGRDAASAFRLVLSNQEARGLFNVGSPDAPPLRQTIETIRDLIDPRAELGFGDLPYRSDQVMVLHADVGRLSALGWRPTTTLAVGLTETVASYDAFERS